MQNTIIPEVILLAGLPASGALTAERKAAAEKTRPEAAYHNYCSVCHGDRSRGAVWAAGNTARAPRDFTTAATQELTRVSMIADVAEYVFTGYIQPPAAVAPGKSTK